MRLSQKIVASAAVTSNLAPRLASNERLLSKGGPSTIVASNIANALGTASRIERAFYPHIRNFSTGSSGGKGSGDDGVSNNDKAGRGPPPPVPPKRKFFDTNEHPLVPLGPTPTKLVSFTVHEKPLLPSLATYVHGNFETLRALLKSLLGGQARVAVFFKPEAISSADDSSATGCYAQVQRIDFKMKNGMEYRLFMNHADSSLEFWKVDVRKPGSDRRRASVVEG